MEAVAGKTLEDSNSPLDSEDKMVILGLILLVLGLVLNIQILVVLGAILAVVGLILNLVPMGGRRRVYY